MAQVLPNQKLRVWSYLVPVNGKFTLITKIPFKRNEDAYIAMERAGFRSVTGLHYVRGSDGSITASCGWDRGGEFAVIAVVGQEVEVYSLAEAARDKLIEDR